MTRTLPILMCLASLVSACAHVSVNFALASVPEEGGVRFTQLTTNEDVVLGPNVAWSQIGGSVSPNSFLAVTEDGKRFGFLAFRGGNSNVFLHSTLGASPTQQRTFGHQVQDVAFSPGDSLIAFSEFRDGSMNVYAVGLESGSTVRQVSSSQGAHELDPIFSPDGHMVYYTKVDVIPAGGNGSSATWSIWSYDLRNAAVVEYGEGIATSISPDGRTLLLARKNRDTNRAELWARDLTSGKESIILSDPRKGFLDAHFSPDGSRIVFASRSESPGHPVNMDLYVSSRDGSGMTQLTFHDGNDLSPRWSPAGDAIYFLSQRGNPEGKWNVWRMELQP